jgi:hypothetical protein
MSDDSNRPFACRAAHSAVGCNCPEMFAFTGIGILQILVCFYLSFVHARQPLPFSGTGSDYFLWFWIPLLIWLLYHTILVTAYFPYTQRSAYLVQAADCIFQMVPTWIVILMLSEMLFTYRNPGRNRVFFARVCLCLFLVIYGLLGILFSFTDVEDMLQTGDSMLLWQGAIRVLTTIFLALPAIKLFSAISYPVLQKDDVSCVRWSTGLFIVLGVLNIGKAGFVLTHYWDINEWANSLWNQITGNPYDQLPGFVRGTLWFNEFVFNSMYTVLLMVAVLILREHEMRFANDPFYLDLANDSDRPTGVRVGISSVSTKIKQKAKEAIGRLSGSGKKSRSDILDDVHQTSS